jgi:hypothetical protein
MRYLFITLMAFSLASSAWAQPEIGVDSSATAITYTRLDALTFDRSSLLTGESAEISFHLVQLEQIGGKKELSGVEVNIERKDRQQTGGSIALAAAGSVVGVGGSVTYRQIRQSGYIFLSPENLRQLEGFLDKIVGRLSNPPDKYTVWRLSVQKGFEMGMRYDPSKGGAKGAKTRPRWSFIITAEDATYALDYSQGISLIQAFAGWRDRI